MVDVHPSVFRLSFLLATLTLALPQASAGPLDRAEDLVGTAGPGGDDLVSSVDDILDDWVRFTVYDVDGGSGIEVGAVGLELQMQASCAAAVAAEESSCTGNVCVRDSGTGPHPVSIGNHAEGYYGFGVDVDWLLGPGQGDESDQAGTENQYGPYRGAFYDRDGQCGA